MALAEPDASVIEATCMPRHRRSSASESDDGTSANSDDSLDDSKKKKNFRGQSSTDSDSRSSDSSDEESGARRPKQSVSFPAGNRAAPLSLTPRCPLQRSRSTLLPIILLLAILAVSALAYYFYSRSAVLPSTDAPAASNIDNSSQGGAVTTPDTPTGDATIESSSADGSETVTSRPTVDTSEGTAEKSSSTDQTGAATKVRRFQMLRR